MLSIIFNVNKAIKDSLNRPFLDLDISISKGNLKTNIDQKQDFSFTVKTFPFID